MFMLNDVTVRMLETDDVESLYAWHLDPVIGYYAGWEGLKTRANYHTFREQRIIEPRENMREFGIVAEGRLVGDIQLARIDRENRTASVGLAIGDKSVWGRGIAKTALCILLDYAFTVQSLDKVNAEVYGFNTRSQRLMEAVGFQKEGVLRLHEIHNGERQDMHCYGILKPEFYALYKTIFAVPAADKPEISLPG